MMCRIYQTIITVKMYLNILIGIEPDILVFFLIVRKRGPIYLSIFMALVPVALLLLINLILKNYHEIIHILVTTP